MGIKKEKNMITSRVELQVSMSQMNEGIELQKSLFKEGGPYHNVVKGYRIFQAYFSGQNNIIAVEVDFESLGDFESAHQKMLSQVSEEEWKIYREIFNQPATWTHW
ncbi:MAG: hypothetical protein AAGD96_25990, partial [Chloroflexota bacterium]